MRPRPRTVILGLILPIALPGCESASRHEHERFELAMLERLESPHPTERFQAVTALSDVALTGRGMAGLRRALGDPDVRVRLAAAGTLASTSHAPELRAPVRPILLGALREADPAVRASALRTMVLEPWRDSLTAGLMIPLLRDTAMDVRATAAQALSVLGRDARSAIPALEKASRDSVAYVRDEVRNAIRIIRRAGTGRAPEHRSARPSLTGPARS